MRRNLSFPPCLVRARQLFLLVVFLLPAILFSQVSGTVLDAENTPLIGASILVKGETTGTVTDIDGKYTINAGADDILVVSYVGYATQEIGVGGRTVIDVVLASDASQLAEVVVIGYGSQTKANLTGSVGLVTSKDLESRPITSASQSLQGQVSGVWVNQNSGEPGQDGAQIRIRGIGTLNSSNPLILVDGIEAPFNNIDPNDIESITVLKDAASAAIYGSRAANGVILITTKRGKKNAKPTFTYNGYAGPTEVISVPDYVWNSKRFMELRNEADQNSGRPGLYPADVVSQYGSGPNTNWFDEMFQAGSIQQHNLSVAGGSESTNFSLSMGYLDQDPIVKFTDGTQRYNARLNMDTKVTKNFGLGASMYVSRQVSNLDNVGQDGGIIARATRLGPNFPAFDSQGRLADRDRTLNAIELSTPNILAEIQAFNRILRTQNFLGSVYAQYSPVKGLDIRGTFAANYEGQANDFFNRRVETYDWRSGNPGLIWLENRQLTNETLDQLNLTSWLQATYEKNIGNHTLKFLAGANQESSNRKFFSGSRLEIPSNSLPALATGNPATSTNSGGEEEWALRSFFGRINYAFNNKYLLEFNVRRDGSSRFGSNNRWATFPSFSAGWVVSEESFFQVPFIDFMKIRASVGQLGNQNIGNYPFARLVSFTPAYNFGGNIVGAAAQTTLGNPDIRWETTTQTDIGVNVGLLDGKLSIEADYFNRVASDILFNQNNPAVTGVRTPTTVNIAKVRNRGWEFNANYQHKFSNGLGFSVGGNVTNVVSEVLQIDPSLTGEADRVFQGDFIIQRGAPINAIYGLRAISIFQNQSEIDGAPDQSAFTTPQPGDLRYEDVNNDGKITIDDRVVLGQDNPEWIYGFNGRLEFKGFDIAALFQGIADAQVLERGRFFAPFNNSGGVATMWEDRWTPSNPDASLPRITIGQGGVNHNVTHSWWMTDRSYLRLKNLQIGYNFPAEKLKATKFIQSLRVFVNGTNLWTLTDFIGFDPEQQERNTNAGAVYPQLKIYTGGVVLKF